MFRILGYATIALLLGVGGAGAAEWQYDPESKVAAIEDGADRLTFDCMTGSFSGDLEFVMESASGLASDSDIALAVAADASGLADAETFMSDDVSRYGDADTRIAFYSETGVALARAVVAMDGPFILWAAAYADARPEDFVKLKSFDGSGATEAIDTVFAGCRAASGLRPDPPEIADNRRPEPRIAGETPEIDKLLMQARVRIELIRDGQDKDRFYLDEAIDFLDKAVALDSNVARLQLAQLYLSRGTDAEGQKAKALLETLHANGDIKGAAELGQYLALDEQNWAEALPLLTVAASNGDAQAMFLLYMAYDDGTGVEHDATLARRWLEKSADAGRSRAQAVLASMLYSEGDAKRAWGYLKGAIEQNEYTAWTLAGIFFETGAGGADVDIAKAIDAYQRGSSIFSGNAQFYLAGIYDHGKGFIDPELAAVTLHQALRLGGSEVGDSLAKGFKDFSKATRKELQKLLKRIGDYDGAIDGVLGKGTIATLDTRYSR